MGPRRGRSTTGAQTITTLLGSFVEAVRNVGAVDRIAAAAMKLPDRFVGRVTIFSAVAASTVSEGAAKPVKNISLTMADFTPVKTVAQVVLSQEAIDSLEDEGLRILGNELKNSVAHGGDSAFLAALTGESGESQGLDSWQGINDDLEELLRDLRLGVGSRPFFITTPNIAKGLAVKAITNGIPTLRWDDPRKRRANGRTDHRRRRYRPRDRSRRSRAPELSASARRNGRHVEPNLRLLGQRRAGREHVSNKFSRLAC
jgi:hypothetical protein